MLDPLHILSGLSSSASRVTLPHGIKNICSGILWPPVFTSTLFLLLESIPRQGLCLPPSYDTAVKLWAL